MRRKPDGTYLYRGHELTRMVNGDWSIYGPAVQDTAKTLEDAERKIDQAPGTPPKLTRVEAGRLGAREFYRKYYLQPSGPNGFAICHRDTGAVKSYLQGRPW